MASAVAASGCVKSARRPAHRDVIQRRIRAGIPLPEARRRK